MKAPLALVLLLLFSCSGLKDEPNASNQPSPPKPRVVILTDINNAGGDPDDKQSLIHLLWYADELDIRGIVPDYWNGKGYEATMEGIAAYEKDYLALGLADQAYPDPESLIDRVAQNDTAAVQMLYQEAMASQEPLYVLIWGSMKTFKNALFAHPEIAPQVRVLTIGTGRKYGPKDEELGEDCEVVNWNGKGRNEIYEDSRFDDMWWLESNWTYNGMFIGETPAEMLQALSRYGAMGSHLKGVVQEHAWAQYFRVGDTPTVLYLIDSNNNLEDPTYGSWAGQFAQPFPANKPNYYTDDAGPVDWNYEDPCETWENAAEMYAYNKNTLFERRDEMYQALLLKLEKLYGRGAD